MTNYFANLELSFPSLVATVGRTTEKLAAPTFKDGNEQEKSDLALAYCLICTLPMKKDSRSWLEDISVTRLDVVDSQRDAQDSRLSNERTAKASIDVGDQVCYGCLLSLSELKGELAWPNFVASRPKQDH